MNAIHFAGEKKNGSAAKAIAVPCNRSQEASFNWVDAGIVGFFVLITTSVISWLLLR